MDEINETTANAEDGKAATTEEPDYKTMWEQAVAESRKWEDRSKANVEKAKAYDELQASTKTVEERLAAIESENASLKAERERAKSVRDAARATGVDEAIVSTLSGASTEELTEQAQAIAEAMSRRQVSPAISEAGVIDRATATTSKESILAIKDNRERIRAMAKNPELFRNN